MILFFRTPSKSVIAVECDHELTQADSDKLCWLFGEATPESEDNLKGHFVGPRREMITPWSTNAVEITQNMGLDGIIRIEEYFPVKDENADHDPMLQRMYKGLDQNVFTTNRQPEPIVHIEDLEAYNEKEGLALSKEEMDYLKKVEKDLGRPLTDSEVFGFAQINSEHCRHKIFGGTFIIDGVEQESSLFQMIKKTTQENPNKIISAYKDNVAFAEGPVIEQFAPADHSKPDYFQVKDIKSVISLKAETHNFPTTVEPFNGASTGTGGEIRDRMGGGKGSWPIAGTAVYMTSYPRTEEGRPWEEILPVRKWLYQTPEQILIKASNGASDFGNKFGQPLICGSVLTFEHKEKDEVYGYDKVIMLAGGVGYGTQRDCLKGTPEASNKVVVIGGDNYRIGLGGGSVSSVDTGRYSSGIELNAVQRANAEMQKRAYNVVRALCEEETNPVVSIHDHGSAGHVNCLSELVEECGGLIDMSKLPIGDTTLSAKEIIANESQERMGLLIQEEAIEHVRKVAERERAPMYVVGETTGDHRFAFQQADGVRPFDLAVEQMFGSSPKTYMVDKTVERHYEMPQYEVSQLHEYLTNVLQLEAVACKDWLTNKVDRSVTGKIARQQCQGELQLPLSDCGVVALDYRGEKGIATSLGHAPQAALADPAAGSVLSVSEALTNLVWAPLAEGLDSVSLSANWMWPCRSQEGEDARLYTAVKALSDFCCSLQINVPTGKDSLSMTQKYPDGSKVISPGTVIVSAGGEVSDVKKVVSPVLVNNEKTTIYHIDFSFDNLKLGGSAFAQTLGKVGDEVPSVQNAEYFRENRTNILKTPSRTNIISGVTSFSPQNLMEVKNQGVEVEVGWDHKIKDFGYRIKANIAYNHNEIIEQNEQIRKYPYMNRTGGSIGQQFSLIADGFYNTYAEIAAGPTQYGTLQPGDVRFRDINGDGVINDYDIAPFGFSDVPEITGSFQVGLSYKNFDLTVMFQGATRVTIPLTGEVAWEFFNLGSALADRHLARWTPETQQTATYHRMSNSSGSNQNNFKSSSMYLYDASYLRLKNVELSYNFPKKWFTHTPISALRMYVNGFNLLTWDKLKVIDPEAQPANRGNFYPQQRIYNLGVNVTF